MDFIPRLLGDTILRVLPQFPIVALTGPRQSGKTTLARRVLPDWNYVSLEDLDARGLAVADPRAFLQRHGPRTIIDEFQRAPELTSYLQTAVDERNACGQYLLTGSQSYTLHAQVSQSLAGRVALLTLPPLSWEELGGRFPQWSAEEAAHRGGYPAVMGRAQDRALWFASHLATYVERDVRQLLAIRELAAFQRLLKLLALRAGQLLNMSSLAVDAGVSVPTIANWLSVLEAGYIVQRLQPWHANAGKRLVRTPKLYFHDTGLLCHLLEIDSPQVLGAHPLRGAVFENWVLLEMQKARWGRGREQRIWFWRDQRGREIDFVLSSAGSLLPIEVKAGTTVQPDWFKGLRVWLAPGGGGADTVAEPLATGPKAHVVYQGADRHPWPDAEVVPWRATASIGQPGGGD